MSKRIKKNKSDIKVSFIGENADGVTGSCILIEYNKKKMLLEYGMYQSHNKLEAYKINAKRNKEFKAKDLTYVAICHHHSDHGGLAPKLVREGFDGLFIVPSKSMGIGKEMLEDSAKIIAKDAEYLTKSSRSKNVIHPMYDLSDVEEMMFMTREYDEGIIHRLDDEVSFRFTPSGHIIRAMQLELWITDTSGKTHKICYTSDIGNVKFKKRFVEDFQPIESSELLIAESTYSNKSAISRKAREDDIGKIKTIVQEVCNDNNSTLIIPVFSLDRAQNILSTLYEIYGDDKDFDVPIIYDAPLSQRLTKEYIRILDRGESDFLKKVMAWKHLYPIEEHKTSETIARSKNKKIVVATGGMMSSGRILTYLEHHIKDKNSHILFCGYNADGTLGRDIQDGTKKKVNVNGKSIVNNIGITSLRSFSGHMDEEDMLEYYSNHNTSKIALVHGNFEDKLIFAEKLKDAIADKNKSTNVIAVNKGTTISL